MMNAMIVMFPLFFFISLSANFLWPSLGVEYGIAHTGVWLSIFIGLCVETVLLKQLIAEESWARIFLVSLLMNAASAAFGIAFVSLIDISAQHFLGIAWLWHIIIVYTATVITNICIEGLVVLRFFPFVSKQRLIFLLAIANAITVAIGFFGVKMF